MSIITPQKDTIDELMKEIKDLQIKLAKLQEKRKTSQIKPTSK